MKRGLFTIQTNQELAPATHRMVLAGDTGAITAPGQFVNIALAGKFLRRPISVCDWDETTLTLIYKVVGQGTAQMAQMSPGETLDLLTGLGNGYDLSINKYKEVEYIPVEYPPTSEIMANIRELEMEIGNEMDELEKLLGL